MQCKFERFFRLTVSIGLIAVGCAQAVELAAPIPVAVAESEAFEVVGRLETEGLVLFVDRSDTNAPVLGAELEIEQGGQAMKASFRAERGDYLIADPTWLKPLRQPGKYALAMTLVAGQEADLLATELEVAAPPAEGAAGDFDLRWGLLLVIGALAIMVWTRRMKGGNA